MNTNRFRFADGAPGSAEERKASLRAYMKKRRGENENRDAKEDLLLENFIRSGAAEKERFFVYLSFSSEAPTDKLVAYLLAAGKKVYSPVTEGNRMYAAAYGKDFSLSSFGIREPVGEEYKGGLDVAVLPLLAVDGRGARLGYGRGYYDRFPAERPEVLTVAYCYDFQIVREVPETAGDRRVSMIVSDKRVLRCPCGV